MKTLIQIIIIQRTHLVHVADNKSEGSGADELISLWNILPRRPVLFYTRFFRTQSIGIGAWIRKVFFDRALGKLLALSDTFCTTGGALDP